jgi:hypothetical protein
MKDCYHLISKSELDIYYRVEDSAFLLFLKEFTNIQTSGNPVIMIQTIAIPPIAIAKLDWILAIASAPSYVNMNNRIYGILSTIY